MTRDDYPALYRAASNAASSAQTTFLNCVRAYTALAVIGAGLATYGIKSTVSAILAAILFIGGLALSLLMAFKRYESSWYRARAVAESIKTASWRFMMRAEPFGPQQEPASARTAFAHLLQNILNEHKHLLPELVGSELKGEQLTDSMMNTRKLPLTERIVKYLDERVNEQCSWYADRSGENRIWGRFWFAIFIALQVSAVVFVILRIMHPSFDYWPTEIFVVGASGIFGWMQIKRFRELSAAYSLAATEIGIARTLLPDVDNDDKFSKFVADTESAFSREHTQWVARRDSGV